MLCGHAGRVAQLPGNAPDQSLKFQIDPARFNEQFFPLPAAAVQSIAQQRDIPQTPMHPQKLGKYFSPSGMQKMLTFLLTQTACRIKNLVVFNSGVGSRSKHILLNSGTLLYRQTFFLQFFEPHHRQTPMIIALPGVVGNDRMQGVLSGDHQQTGDAVVTCQR